jgi:hypothetical protein
MIASIKQLMPDLYSAEGFVAFYTMLFIDSMYCYYWVLIVLPPCEVHNPCLIIKLDGCC